LRRAQHHHYLAACQILLVPHVVVGGEEQIEPGTLRFRQEVAVVSLSHPRSLAFVTLWPVRYEARGAGVL
jgi:hypothetical protein